MSRPLQNLLHGTWLGHPLHPVLTDVPIGAWTTAVVLDLIDVSTRRRRGYGRAADSAIALGIIGALGAAASGLTDWRHTGARGKRLGLVHGALNTAALALFGSSLLLRGRGRRAAGRVLSTIGGAVVLASAYLGGDLVYRERIGVNHADDSRRPRGFVPVLPAAELAEGKPRRVEAEGIPIVLVRTADRIYALGEVCAHLGGPLSEGSLADGGIVCPWHGSRFRLEDGCVIDGPATTPQPCFDAVVRNGMIEVRYRPEEERHQRREPLAELRRGASQPALGGGGRTA
ncbi:DUF2231 domain-containing protein [Sorangium sp. KYC3313]|uniref:DUF2231 domain-containing protein n=1 Tax=Sorangium sp. KYC3313 TaxID=3449740 RepID=UPI003F89A7D4